MSITITLPLGYKPVLKHGEHDQSSHGSWATNNFDEETQGDEAQGNYFDKYGMKTDGSKEPVGISRDEIRSLDDYTGDGYKKINQYLRLGGTSPYEEGSYYDRESLGINENRVADLDKLIEESPDLFGDKNLYRVFASEVLQDLNNGDVLTDRAFLSTTRVDITSEKGLEVLENLQMISEADDRTAIILPSPSRSGKGLAVDYMKNAVSDLFANVSTASDEKEVILPRNTPLKYMGLKEVSRGKEVNMVVAVFQRMEK
jgi:hypothetical protein